MADWVGGPLARPGVTADSDPRGDHQSYLFGRSGDPTELAVPIVARAWLVAVCSGGVLAVGGFLILVWRPSPRLVAVVGVLLVLSVASLLHPSVTILIAQSAMLGVLLTALLGLMQWLVDRRRPGPVVYAEPGSRATALGAAGSTMSRVVTVGSDDPTSIRPRPVAPSATLDHMPSPPIPGPDGNGAGTGSRAERAGRGGAGL